MTKHDRVYAGLLVDTVHWYLTSKKVTHAERMEYRDYLMTWLEQKGETVDKDVTLGQLAERLEVLTGERMTEAVR